MKHREFKDRLYEELGRVARAIDSPRRLELIDLLAQGERSVEDLAAEAMLSMANTSQHLQVLRGARLVEARKEGLRVYYRLAQAEVHGVARAVRGLAQARLAEVDHLVQTHLESRDELEPLPREELLRRIRGGRAVVIDVRPREEYRAGHIPGALSIPLGELDKRLSELPARKEIVAYCRGPYCVMAYEAVARLRARGRRARRLTDGFPEWRASGLPVQTSAQPR
ncbi:MAG: ArsR family transcriptional regulator [Acidobacteria bacterium]|nr:MAG: ArsR family transcriptional regulator [Acidobacteriota bacterium]